MKLRTVAEIVALVGAASVALYFIIPSARRTGRTQNCQSNLKQIGLGMGLYIRDYDERTPLHPNWAESMRPYMIPRRPGSEDEKTFKIIYSCWNPNTNYALNRFYAGINVSQITAYQTSVAVFDSMSPKFCTADFGASFPRVGVHSTGYRATRGSNVLFTDGHVELVNRKPKFERFPPISKPLIFPQTPAKPRRAASQANSKSAR